MAGSGVGGGGVFGDLPSAWGVDEKWKYLPTDVAPLMLFVLAGVLFWALGAKIRKEIATQAPEEVVLPD